MNFRREERLSLDHSWCAPTFAGTCVNITLNQYMAALKASFKKQNNNNNNNKFNTKNSYTWNITRSTESTGI
jgi:hypothetical protein